jgi:hypothetical protein
VTDDPPEQEREPYRHERPSGKGGEDHH